MGMPKVRFDNDDTGTYFVDLDTPGFAVRVEDYHVGHPEDFGQASATSLRHAMLRAERLENYCSFRLCSGDRSEMAFEFPPDLPISFEIVDEQLRVELVFATTGFVGQPGQLRRHVERILGPILERSKTSLASVSGYGYDVDEPHFVYVSLIPDTRGRSVRELLEIGLAAEALLQAAASGELTRDTVLDLLRGGHWRCLLGQSEGPWIDAKRQDYNLSPGSDRGKISIARDVASFANSESGGLVVVGFATKKSQGSDTITKLTPVLSLPKGTTRHLRSIDARVFPPVDGLTVEEVLVKGGSIIIINIPPQPNELKPFLVSGAILEDQVEGAFISVVRRRGEETLSMRAESIHAALAVGTAVLRDGKPPQRHY